MRQKQICDLLFKIRMHTKYSLEEYAKLLELTVFDYLRFETGMTIFAEAEFDSFIKKIEENFSSDTEIMNFLFALRCCF